MGATSDHFGIARAMLVPMLCFMAIFLFAWRRTKGGEVA
jgi:fucose permease